MQVGPAHSHALTLTSTWPGPGTGLGTSRRSSGWPTAWKTIARTGKHLLHVRGFAYLRRKGQLGSHRQSGLGSDPDQPIPDGLGPASAFGSILYHLSGMNKKIGHNFEFFTPCDFIAAITQHVPDDDFQLLGYYGPLYGEEVKVRTWHCRDPEHYL